MKNVGMRFVGDAVQYHIDVEPYMTPEEQKIAENACKFSLAGLIAIRSTPRRVIVTTATPKDQQDAMGEVFIQKIQEAFEEQSPNGGTKKF